jgi:phospholipid N-methyltransferase
MSSPELRQHTPDDFGRFFKSWIRNPLAMGAVAPSGKMLAKRMATGLDPSSRVVELGSGTGTVTQAVLDAGVKPENLSLIEQDPHFLRILARRFPSVHRIAGDALHLTDYFADSLGTFDFVISGLPLLLFTPERRRTALSQMLTVLKPEGVVNQFTYAARCPVDRELRKDLGIESTLIGIAALNLPPAFVYRLARV